VNLSGMAKIPAPPLKRPRRPLPEPEDGARYVAFVMSDGDNIQWLTGGFVDHRSYWGSPLRGKFPFTWEVSPLLSELAPRALHHFYTTARPTEGFVTGPGVPGYTFPHFQTDRAALARQARPYLRDSDLSVVSVLNDNAGEMAQVAPILDLPEVEGVIYKDYAPYHRRRGSDVLAQKEAVRRVPVRAVGGADGAGSPRGRRGPHARRPEERPGQLRAGERPCLVVRERRRPAFGGGADHRASAAEHPRRHGGPVDRDGAKELCASASVKLEQLL
jgi:hypothetical protein